MIPRIETIEEKKLIGQRITTSLASNDTFALWRSFMLRRKDIQNTIGEDLYSIEIYDTSIDFTQFTPHMSFEKWAAVEVSNLEIIPDGLEALVIPSGLYAVFIHKGLPSDYPKTAQYIFGNWLPQSAYVLDHRPHFEIMTPTYRADDPNAEEEVWVPVREKRPS